MEGWDRSVWGGRNSNKMVASESKNRATWLSSFYWYANGIVVGILVAATANGLSYYFRSQSLQGLLDPMADPQALGFPFEIWRRGTNYSGGQVNFNAMAWNALLAVCLGLGIGIIFNIFSESLERFKDHLIEQETLNTGEQSVFQFSLIGMIQLTAIFAGLFSVIRFAIESRPELLIGIYLLGPTSLILVSMMPKGLTWQQRVGLIAPSTVLLIGLAIFAGLRVSIPLDHVVMSIFINWVPQTVIAAGCLTVYLAIRYNRSRGRAT